MVEVDDEFAHESHERDFLGFACRYEPVVKRFQDGVVASGHEGRHIEDSAHLHLAAANRATTAVFTTVAVVARNSGQGAGLVVGAERGEILGFGVSAETGFFESRNPGESFDVRCQRPAATLANARVETCGERAGARGCTLEASAG